MPSDAAFREALEDFGQAYADYDDGGDGADLDAARARVLALYAEREGEEYEVRFVGNSDTQYGTWHDLELFKDGGHSDLREGDRVRLVRGKECGE